MENPEETNIPPLPQPEPQPQPEPESQPDPEQQPEPIVPNEPTVPNETDPKKEVQTVEPISWSGSEFIAHPKNKTWFLWFSLVILAIVIAVYFLTKSIFSAVIIFIIGIVFEIVAGRNPKTLDYTLDSDGLHMGSKFYPYDGFKSFSVYEEGGVSSIRFNPFKRFSPSVNIYYEQADEEKIANMIGEYLPHEEISKDPIDQLMHKIHY